MKFDMENEVEKNTTSFQTQRKAFTIALTVAVMYIFLCMWMRPTAIQPDTISLGRIGGIYPHKVKNRWDPVANPSKSVYLNSKSDPDTLTAISYNILGSPERINHVVDSLVLLNNMYDNDVFLLQEVSEMSCVEAIRNHEVLSKVFPYQTSLPGADNTLHGPRKEERESEFLQLFPSWDSITGDPLECSGSSSSGIQVLSRFPILNQHTLFYSFACRAALYVNIVKEKDGVRRIYHVINTHLFPFPNGDSIRRNQVKEMARWIAGDCSNDCSTRSSNDTTCSGICKFMDPSEPLIIGGDFNIRFLEDRQELEDLQSLLNVTHMIRYNDGIPSGEMHHNANAVYGTPINPRDVIDSSNPYINDLTAVNYGYLSFLEDSFESETQSRNVCGIHEDAGIDIPQYRGRSEFLDYILVGTRFYNADSVYNQKVITYGYGDLLKLANKSVTLEALSDSLPCVWDRDLRMPGARDHKAIPGKFGIDRVNKDNAIVPVLVYKKLQPWKAVMVNHASDHLPVVLKIRIKSQTSE